MGNAASGYQQPVFGPPGTVLPPAGIQVPTIPASATTNPSPFGVGPFTPAPSARVGFRSNVNVRKYSNRAPEQKYGDRYLNSAYTTVVGEHKNTLRNGPQQLMPRKPSREVDPYSRSPIFGPRVPAGSQPYAAAMAHAAGIAAAKNAAHHGGSKKRSERRKKHRRARNRSRRNKH